MKRQANTRQTTNLDKARKQASLRRAFGKDMKELAQKNDLQSRQFYNVRSVLGNSWAIFYILLGGRQAGKSYAVTEFYVKQFKKYGRPFTWLRLSDTSSRLLLQNNAEKLVDPDIRRRYNLDLVTNGTNVYNVDKRAKPDPKTGKAGKILKKTLMARVLNLATFYNDKGSALYDKDFLKNPKMYYNIALDEMNREKSEKNTFDILYSFVNSIENIIRATKQRVRIFMIGNTLEEASDLLCAFNFIPEKFGRFKLKKKRAVIDYIEPTKAYLEMRKGSVADILLPNASTFTNKIDVDRSLITKQRLRVPNAVIKFTKDKDDWFTLWDTNVISRYNGEKKQVVAMRPYLDEPYNVEMMSNIFQIFDSRGFKFKDLMTFKTFQKDLALLKPRK